MKRRSIIVTAVVLVLGLTPGLASGATGDISTVAGTGTAGYTNDGLAATTARVNGPTGMATDAAGNLYIADRNNHVIRRVDAGTGIITTVAGTGTEGWNGDDQPAVEAHLNGPTGVAFDLAGNLHIADRLNHRIRRVDAGTGLITTVAGTGAGGFNGDNQPAVDAWLQTPSGIDFDEDGNLYIADTFNHRIRRVDAGTGTIWTIAGTGTEGFSGDGAAATAATLAYPRDVAVESTGYTVFVADTGNNRIRRIDGDVQTITTAAGTGTQGYNGDGIAGHLAHLDLPHAVAVDSAGVVYIADTLNRRIRSLDAGTIATVAGDGTAGYSGDGGPATTAQLSDPEGVAVATDGTLYIGDTESHRVRRVEPADTDGDGFPDLIDNFPLVYSKCRDQQATIIGTEGPDVIHGTEGPDVIMGFGGDDIIYGHGGNDLICAGAGHDTVYGGDGRDKIYGENGHDALYGELGSDWLYGGNGNDNLQGGKGTRDKLFGGGGTNLLNGGAGDADQCTLGPTFKNCEVIS